MVLVLLGACASTGGGIHEERRVADDAFDPADAPTQVVVNNRSWERVAVYITQNTEVWHLGEVEPMTRRTLPLKNAGEYLLGRTASFVGRPVAGTALHSEAFSVTPGGGIPTWTIEQAAGLSSVSFR
jgi:hypothetical protein